MMSWFYLQSSLKRVKRRTPKKKQQQKQWYSCFEKKISGQLHSVIQIVFSFEREIQFPCSFTTQD